MVDHLVRWNKQYGEKGFTIVDVASAKSMEKLSEHAKAKSINYAVAFDEGGKSGKTYGLQAIPVAYLIGRDGKVIWEGNPTAEVSKEGGKDAMEKRIADALAAKAAPAKAGY